VEISLQAFYQSTNPSLVLDPKDAGDRARYVDFAEVRGGAVVDRLRKRIAFFSPDVPTCALFTGHIGCGKSTELRRLQADLEGDGFHVVYFESSDDLEMTDVDIGDVLLAIARRLSQSLEAIELGEPQGLRQMLKDFARLMTTDFEMTGGSLGPGKLPGLPPIGVDVGQDQTLTLDFAIGKITAKAKSDATLRQKLNQYIAPQTNKLLELVNTELIEPAIARLKQQGKRGLVLIVDNLDRIDSRPKPSGRPQQEYLFVDRGEYLAKLRCHAIYTLPLRLLYANDYGMLTQRFSQSEPQVLPMVPVQRVDGTDCTEGVELLHQMVLRRADPALATADEAQTTAAIAQLFDSPASLDRLCRVSGGDVRGLLQLLNAWIVEDMALPLTAASLERTVRTRRDNLMKSIDDQEWAALKQVRQRKQDRNQRSRISDPEQFQTLIYQRLVFEYRDGSETWFDVNPLLWEAIDADLAESQPES
jgi:hypothetical protein